MDLLPPLVFSACGGYGHEAHQFIKKLLESIAEKRDFETSVVMIYIRTKISFALHGGKFYEFFSHSVQN